MSTPQQNGPMTDEELRREREFEELAVIEVELEAARAWELERETASERWGSVVWEIMNRVETDHAWTLDTQRDVCVILDRAVTAFVKQR